MYFITVIKQQLGSAKMHGHTLLDETSVNDRYQWYLAATFGVFVDENNDMLNT